MAKRVAVTIVVLMGTVGIGTITYNLVGVSYNCSREMTPVLWDKAQPKKMFQKGIWELPSLSLLNLEGNPAGKKLYIDDIEIYSIHSKTPRDHEFPTKIMCDHLKDSLVEISAKANRIKHVNKCIKNFKRLRLLNLENNLLGSTALPKEFFHLGDGVRYFFGGNPIAHNVSFANWNICSKTNSPVSCKNENKKLEKIVAFIKSNFHQSMEHIDLSGNMVVNGLVVRDVLDNCTRLKRLDVSNNQIASMLGVPGEWDRGDLYKANMWNRLEEIKMDGNPVTVVDLSLAQSDILQTMDLRENALSGNHFSKDGKGTSDPKFDEKDYVFTNPQMILRVMQDRQQTRTGFKTLRLYRDPKAAGQRAHKCEVTKDSIRHGLSKQGFNVSEKVAGEVFLKIAGQGCGEALTGGQFLEKLRDSTNKISRFGSAKPMFTSRTRKGKHAVPVVERGTIVDQIRTKQRTEVPNYDTAANKIKGFSTAQVEKYKHIARNRARDNFVSQQNDERHIKRVEQLYRKKAKNHGAALGGAMARGDGRPVVQVRKKSPRTTIVIRDRNDKRSGRSSIMTHMFAQSGWEIGHGHGRHLAGYNDENAKH
eukprot:g1089.t1